MQQAEQAGFWKLVSRVFVENITSRTLLRSLGFREVSVYEKHAQLDGVWRDVVIVLTGNCAKPRTKISANGHLYSSHGEKWNIARR